VAVTVVVVELELDEVEAVAVDDVVEAVELVVEPVVEVVELEVEPVAVVVVVEVVEDVVLIALLPKSIASHLTTAPVPAAAPLEVVISLSLVSSALKNEPSFWPEVKTHCIL